MEVAERKFLLPSHRKKIMSEAADRKRTRVVQEDQEHSPTTRRHASTGGFAGVRAQLPPSSSLSPTTAAHRARLHRLVSLVRDWDAAGGQRLSMFHFPVTDGDVPGYSDVIKQPIDLQTLDRRIDRGAYDDAPPSTPSHPPPQQPPAVTSGGAATSTSSSSSLLRVVDALHEDVVLMINNALLFNEEDSVWFRHARSLAKRLDSMFRQAGLETSAMREGDESFVAINHRKGREEAEESELRRDERKAKEVVSSTLAAMEEDLKLSVEELRAKYQRANEEQIQKEKGKKKNKHGDDDDDAASGSDAAAAALVARGEGDPSEGEGADSSSGSAGGSGDEDDEESKEYPSSSAASSSGTDSAASSSATRSAHSLAHDAGDLE